MLGTAIYSTDGRSLEAVVGDLLRQRQWTISAGVVHRRTAMSPTDVAGNSDYVSAGVVCYSNRSKIDWLGVPNR